MRSWRFSKILIAVVLVISGTALGLLLAEFPLRAAGLEYLPQSIFFIPDAYTGWANRPGASGRWGGEGRAQVSINRDGWRDVEHAISKSPATLRIAVLGDSFTAAFQVAQSDDFNSVTQRSLNSCAALDGSRPEVMNFGVNAFGTGQELITLERRVWQYSPDIVIVAFFDNDIYDNSEALQRRYPDYVDAARPDFDYSSGVLAVTDSSARRVKEAMKAESSFRRRVRRFLWRFRIWQLVSRIHAHLTKDPTESMGLLNAPPDDDWKEAWLVTEGLISRFNHEVKSRDARFLLVIVSDPLQVYPGAEARNAELRKAKAPDVFYLNRRLEALGQREGFPVLSLSEPMQRYADEHRVFLHGFPGGMGRGHWNEKGHLMAGQSIAAAVCDMIADRPVQNATSP